MSDITKYLIELYLKDIFIVRNNLIMHILTSYVHKLNKGKNDHF